MPESERFRRIRRGVTTHVINAAIAAIALGVSAYIWELMRKDGGLVKLLGGVSESSLATVPQFPKGAVVAFDRRERCPDGWSEFVAAEGRTIVGVSDRYSFGQEGGAEHIPLQSHDHEYSDVFFSESGPVPLQELSSVEVPGQIGQKGPIDHDNMGWAFMRRTRPSPKEGQDQQDISNMQPFFVLRYCKLQ